MTTLLLIDRRGTAIPWNIQLAANTVDPPRAGPCDRTIDTALETKPPRDYLSELIQARDVSLLQENTKCAPATISLPEDAAHLKA